MKDQQTVSFVLGGLNFEYDKDKEETNIQKHGDCTTVKYSELSDEQKKELLFTPEERRQLDEARNRPIVYDEDCPAVTPEMAIRFRRANSGKYNKRA